MISITASSTETQVLQEELRRSQEREHRLQLRVNALEAEQDFMRRLFSNPNLSPAAKLVLWAIRYFVLGLRVDHHTETDIHISGASGLAKQTGLSTDTVGRLVKRFDHIGVLKRSERSDWQEDANGVLQKRSIVSVALLELADSPQFIVDETAQKHGGARVKRCDACGSDDLWIETSIYCRSCQLRIEHTLEPLNKPIEEKAEEAESDSQADAGGEELRTGGQHDDCECADELPPKPVATEPCRRCQRLNEWGYDEKLHRWICTCYWWWYEHPEWRDPHQGALTFGGERL